MRLAALILLGAGGVAAAQPAPQDPYGPPAPPPTVAPPTIAPAPTTANDQPAPADPVLAEQIAQSLVARAQELFDARLWNDAKQLAIETTLRSPKGASADHARMLIKQINAQLGIPDPDAAKPVDLTPIQDPTKGPPGRAEEPPPADEAARNTQLASYVHGGLLGGLIGATIGTAVSNSSGKEAGGAVAFGLGGAAAGAFATDYAVKKLHWRESQVRTVGAGADWGGVIGGFVADIATGTTGTTGREVMVGASIGAVVGAAGGAGLATQDKYTRGDLALVDTFAGIGTIGGLTIGMLMQPVEGEAYSLNAILGAAGGVVIGLIAAPETNTTPRRMLRVAGCAAIGLAAPFLLYAAIHDSSSTADERVVGLLASGGMVAGTYVGFRVTSGMDDGLDTLEHDRGELAKPVKLDHVDAPPATVTRSSDGTWGIGVPAIAPLSRTLDDRQRGTSVSLLGIRF